ncbi:MAG: hypothetical protein IJT79_00345 [Ruminococcus sp.]|nr:hypothetical protein [Ruminococcus sp.]
MFNEIYKDDKQELRAIKYGLRFDFNFWKRFKRDDFENLDLINLKKYVKKCLFESINEETKDEIPENAEQIRKECLNNDKLYCELKLARLKGTNSYFIPIILSGISIIVSLFIFLMSMVNSVSSTYINTAMHFSNITAFDLEKALQENTKCIGESVGKYFIFVLMVFMIVMVVNTIIETKKQNRIIFYEFMKNCIKESM